MSNTNFQYFFFTLILLGIVTLIVITGCAEDPFAVITISIPLDDVNEDVKLSCPAGRYTQSAELLFWQNGKPKLFQMNCGVVQ